MTDSDYHKIAGMLIACSSTLLLYRFTHIRIGFCLMAGFLVGSTIGVLKEEVYDRKMGKGVPSEIDKMNTGYGSIVGVIISIPVIDRNEKRLEKEEKAFEHLNQKPILKDSL